MILAYNLLIIYRKNTQIEIPVLLFVGILMPGGVKHIAEQAGCLKVSR